jgi:hypothetical protein
LAKTKKHAMKKLFTILLAAGMFSMYACSSSTTNTESSTDTTVVAPAPAPAAPDTVVVDTAAH